MKFLVAAVVLLVAAPAVDAGCSGVNSPSPSVQLADDGLHSVLVRSNCFGCQPSQPPQYVEPPKFEFPDESGPGVGAEDAVEPAEESPVDDSLLVTILSVGAGAVGAILAYLNGRNEDEEEKATEVESDPVV